MSRRAETGETGEMTRPAPARGHVRALELIACDRCGRHFATDDGPGMIALIKGACPDCGGRFQLIDASPEDLLL